MVVKASVLSANTLPSRSIEGSASVSFGAMIRTLRARTHGVRSANEHLWLFVGRPPKSGLLMHGSRCFAPVVGMTRKLFVAASPNSDRQLFLVAYHRYSGSGDPRRDRKRAVRIFVFPRL